MWHLRRNAPWVLANVLRFGTPEMVLHFGYALGDDLLCTAVLRELKRRGHGKLWMMSGYPELYEGNPDVDRVVPIDRRFHDFISLFGAKWQLLDYESSGWAKDKSGSAERNIIAELCARAGVSGRIVLRPYFFLRKEESLRSGWAKGAIAIQSSVLGARFAIRNKEWFPERFQALVSRLGEKFKFIQIGSGSDPRLEGAMDLRGKATIRETAALLANCRLFLGNVGFLMHLARAVECPAVIIYGGREAPRQSGYGCNINLYSEMPCSPCWLWNTCDHSRRCMENITVDDVAGAISDALSRPRNPLAEDSLTSPGIDD